MKKGFAIVIMVLLIGSFVFATEETSRLHLSTTIAESPENSGIRLVVGDPIADKPSGVQSTTHFDNVFTGQANNDLTIEAGDAVMYGDVTGVFTVLVKRGEATPVTVNISATPMQNEDGSANYIGYQIKESGQTTALINTIGSPSSSSSGISYVATSNHSNNNWIRDTKVLEYKVPKTTSAPYGKYTANVYFSITLE